MKQIKNGHADKRHAEKRYSQSGLGASGLDDPRILSVSITASGKQNGARLPYEHYHGGLGETVRTFWPDADGFVLFCAVGVAVRVIAPLLQTKDRDPAVVVVDEACRYVVPVCGGHGGGNDIARDVAGLLGAEAVLTTATDASGVAALDQLPGFVAAGDVAGVTRALLDGHAPIVTSTLAWPAPELSGPVDRGRPSLRPASTQASVVITDMERSGTAGEVVLYPPSLVVGIGASSNAPADAAKKLLDSALEEYGLSSHCVATIATIDRRAPDPVVTSLGLPVKSFTADDLVDIPVPNPSDVVMAEVGTYSVAEAACLLAAGPGAELLVPKQKGETATVAIARRAQPEGLVSVVGLGPGAADLRTPRAASAIRSAEVVIGYDYYVDQVADLCAAHQKIVRSPIGAEVQRCEEAVRRAAEGERVALVCSGDAGIFAMATLVLERGPKFGSPPVKIIPGVTASLAGAALVGAPLAHDHALVSLSDLMTPWDVIIRRVRAVAESDMAVAFYNPRSKRRTKQLVEAIAILSDHRPPSTPVAVVTNASRPEETIRLATLESFEPDVVDMFSLVIVGSSSTRVVDGRMVTPRGYEQ